MVLFSTSVGADGAAGFANDDDVDGPDDDFDTDGPACNDSTDISPAPKKGKIEWRPIHATGVWNEGSKKMCSIAVAFPGGCTEKDDSKLEVSGDGLSVVATMKWPKFMTSNTLLHSFMNKMQLPEYHPRFVSFESFFMTLRPNQSARIESTAKIRLPFKVMKDIQMIKRIGTRDGVRVIYLDLKAQETSAYNDKDVDEFELVE